MKKFLFGSIITALIICLTGCGATASVTQNIDRTMTRLQNTLNNIPNITNEQIITTDIVETSATSSYKNKDVAYVQGNAYNVPNYNRNTDTYGNGFYGIGNYNGYNNGYMGGFNGYNGWGYPNMPGYPGMGYNGYNGNGYVGTNIDTYRENINESNGRNYPKYINGNGYYGNNGYAWGGQVPYSPAYQIPTTPNPIENNPNGVVAPTNNPRPKNINTYKDINTNINSYKHAKGNDTAPEITVTRTPLDTHYSKLSSLCQIQEDVMGCNNDCNNLKNQIMANISYILTLSKEIDKGNLNLTESQKSSINDLLNNITSQTNKLNLAKNELNTELAHVKNLKINYTANIDELSSKYVRLLNCLDSRCTNYQNILMSLYQIQNILNNNQNYCYPYCDYPNNVNVKLPRQSEMTENNTIIDENVYPGLDRDTNISPIEIETKETEIIENLPSEEQIQSEDSQADTKITRHKIHRIFAD